MSDRYILALDQSTSATKAYLFGRAGLRAEYRIAHEQAYPAPGRVTFDADQVMRNVLDCIDGVMARAGATRQELLGLALTNQRESCVLWRRDTGRAVCPALSWQDSSTAPFCAGLADQARAIHALTGAELSPYLSAPKLRAMLDSLPDGHRLAADGLLCAGTVDAFVIYNLTGGQVFACDLSNASRTQLFDINRLEWSDALLKLYGVPRACLPEPRACDAGFGEVAQGAARGLPILAAMGDSQASLYALGCFERGDVKVTYGTGSSVMMQCGDRPILADGLAASVAWSVGGRVNYVLEGNITHSGDTLTWLRDGLGLFGDMDEIERAAQAVPDAGGVYLVPALTGLGAPYNAPGARAAFMGMSRGTRREHLLRAGMESIVYQINAILAAMGNALGTPPKCLHTDGGGTANRTQMQFQADIAGCPVRTSAISAGSPLAVATIAGVRAGLYRDYADAAAGWPTGATYLPAMDNARRAELIAGWEAAVRRVCIDLS